MSTAAAQFKDAAPFKIEGVYCNLIPLSRGKMYSIVDAADYDLLSGITWYAIWSPCMRSYYAATKQGNRAITMDRFILGLKRGDLRQSDHVDPSRTFDNRRKNIRIASRSQQQHNKRRARNNTSGYKGVSWDAQHKKYVAQIKNAGINRRLGFDVDPAKCHELYKAAAAEIHGAFARAA